VIDLRRLALSPLAAMEDVVDRGVGRGEGAGQIADHGRGPAAVVAQVEDHRIGSADEGQRRIRRRPGRILRIVEVDLGELAQIDIADVARQDLDAPEAVVSTGFTGVYRARIRRRSGLRTGAWSRAAQGRAVTEPGIEDDVEMCVQRLETHRQGRGQIAGIGQGVELSGRGGGFQPLGDLFGAAGIEVEIANPRRHGLNRLARRPCGHCGGGGRADARALRLGHGRDR